MKFQIINDLIPTNWQRDILECLREVTWVHQKGTSYKTGPGNFIHGMDVFLDENTIDTVQFVHYAILGNDKTFMFPYLKPLILMLENRIGKKIKHLHRIKINHQSPIPGFTSNNYNIVHSDDERPNLMSMVYYVNDSDGDTFIFNEHHCPNCSIGKITLMDRITPKAGRAIVFPSTQFHASSNPINTPSRFVINATFEVEE